jgi:hypothetical protein
MMFCRMRGTNESEAKLRVSATGSHSTFNDADCDGGSTLIGGRGCFFFDDADMNS